MTSFSRCGNRKVVLSLVLSKLGDQRGVLIVVQDAIARPVALTTVIVQLLQEAAEQLEMLEALEVLLSNLRIGRPCHSSYSMDHKSPARK